MKEVKKAFVPDKKHFYVREAAKIISTKQGVTESAAITRIYRGISNGTLKAIRHLGSMALEKSELVRFISEVKK